MCAADILGLAMPFLSSCEQQRLLSLLLRDDALPLVDTALADSHLLVLRFSQPLVGLPEQLSTSQTPANPPNLFRRRGSVWHLHYQGIESFAPARLGPSYIHHLLQRQDKGVGAEDIIRCTLDFVGVPDMEDDQARAEELYQESDLGPLADGQTLREVRREMRELDTQIEDAQILGSNDRVALLKDQRAQLAAYLASVTGRQGKPRRAGSKAERARQSCQRAITAAIQAIEQDNPLLAAHLRASIHTGRICRYSPPEPVSWQL